MNSLIAFSCLLAVAAATPGLVGYNGLYNNFGYSGLGYSGLGYNNFGYSGAYATPYAGAYAAPLAYAGLATEARQIDPVAIAAGAPLPTGDTVEVAAAKAAHLRAHAAESYKNYGYGYAATPLAYSAYSPFAYSQARLVDPVAIAAGAPLPTGDTVEVAAAKAAHFQAHAVAKSGLRYKRGLGYAVAAPIAYTAGSRAVAYNAPLVAAPHPVAYTAYSGLPIAHQAYSGFPIAHQAYSGVYGRYY